LKDSNQLGSFEGKFTNPCQPKIEQVIKESSMLNANHISKALQKIEEASDKIQDELKVGNDHFSAIFKKEFKEIGDILTAIGEKIQ